MAMGVLRKRYSITKWNTIHVKASRQCHYCKELCSGIESYLTVVSVFLQWIHFTSGRPVTPLKYSSS